MTTHSKKQLDPSRCTLYSGGLKGAEAEFGRNAEAFGLNEVNFSYEGSSSPYSTWSTMATRSLQLAGSMRTVQ